MNDPVTMGDMLSHREMYYSLLKMFPEIQIVSEEKSKDVPDVGSIKPIDLDAPEITEKLSIIIVFAALLPALMHDL